MRWQQCCPWAQQQPSSATSDMGDDNIAEAAERRFLPKLRLAFAYQSVHLSSRQ
jgi:hypothetical protein